jgi:sugar phosphate isomerase/epimerase
MTERLGLTSYAYYWASQSTGSEQPVPLTAWDLLARAADLGLDVIQVCEHMPLVDWDTQQLHALRDAAAGHGVTVEVGTRGLEVEYLTRAVHAAVQVGSPLLRVVPWSGQATRQELSLAKLKQVMDQIVPLCQQSGITVAIENYFDLPDEHLAEFVASYDNDYLGVCLDTANSTGLLHDPLETVRLLAPYAVSVHLKDFVITKSMSGYRIAGAPLGQGWLDVPAVLELVGKAARRRPALLLEHWVDAGDTSKGTLQLEEEWVRQSVVYARACIGQPATG